MSTSSAILVPLDGSMTGAAALPHAVALAKALGRSLRLLAVVERELRGLTSRSERVAAEIEQAAKDRLDCYLGSVAGQLGAVGLPVTMAVAVGDPTDEILAAAHDAGVGAIAMATHGLCGIERWAMGSVAD